MASVSSSSSSSSPTSSDINVVCPYDCRDCFHVYFQHISHQLERGEEAHSALKIRRAQVISTLVPEVFLDFSSRKNQRQAVKRRQQVAKAKWRERKPPVTLASNLTVMQTTGSGSDSEVRGQGNQRFFSLSSSLSRLVVAASRLALDLFREEKSRKTSGTRVLMTFSSMIILYHRRLII